MIKDLKENIGKILKITLCIVMFVTAITPAHANLLFTNDLFYNEAETFRIGEGDDASATNIGLEFGSTNSETLSWSSTNSWFEISGDFSLGQNELKGVALDNQSSAPGSPVLGQIYYDTSNNNTYIWNGTAWEDINNGQVDLDDAYDNDSDKILNIDNASGLEFNSTVAGDIMFDLQSTGDVTFQDAGITFASFTDSKIFDLTGVEDTERIRLTDSTNVDSVGLYTGSDDPDGALSAEAGSLFLDQDGDTYVNRSTGSGTDWGRLIATGSPSQYAQTVEVAKDGAEFTSIKAAIDSITDAGAYKGYIVLVYPGAYTEDPITMKSYVNVVSAGGGIETTIIASNASANLITLASYSKIRGFALSGVTNGNCLYANNTASTAAEDISFLNCQNGLRATGSSSVVKANGLTHITGTTDNYVIAENGAEVQITNASTINGTITNAFHSTGTGSHLHILTSEISGTITNGVYINDGAVVGAIGLIINGATYGTHIGSTGTNSKFRSSGSVYKNIGLLDLFVEINDAEIVFSGGVLDRNKIDIPFGNRISIIFNDETEDNAGTVNLGEFSVGSPENPSESTFGEGDSYTNGMLVYTYNSSTYTDVSTSAQSYSSSTFTLPGTVVNNAIYISSDRQDVNGNYVQFPGHKVEINATALDIGTGELVHEYWNGSSWVEYKVMCTNSTQYYRYTDECYIRPNTSEQVRYETEIKDDWTVNDPPSTGTNRYWTRIRVKTAITTAPIFEQFKVHTNRTEINEDGTITFHGEARKDRTFIFSPENLFFGKGSFLPDNYAFNVGSGSVSWTDERNLSAFTGVGIQQEELTGSIALPKGIDTSSGLIIKMYWMKSDSNTGNVKWKIDYIVDAVQNVKAIDGTNIVTAPRPTGDAIDVTSGSTTTTTATGSSTAESVPILSQFEKIDISEFYEGDALFVRLYRDAGDAEDTYTHDAIMLGFEVSGTFWTIGEAE